MKYSDITFQQWLAEIDKLAAAEGCETSYTQQTGYECWADAYADGVSPVDAWHEEKYCGAYDVA